MKLMLMGLSDMNTGIPASLMEGLGRVEEGIRFPDGTYFASLMVFHHLHCLVRMIYSFRILRYRLTGAGNAKQKNIYHALHPEYYGLDRMTEDEQMGWQDHIGKPDPSNDVADSMILVVNERFLAHCFHMLKEAVMCQGDPMLVTMKWSKDGARPIGNLTSPHECVNWDRLMEWVEPHSVDVFEDGVLVHPKLGTLLLARQRF
ncbi:hypothetical protein F5X98DRAFT_347782 [Xylaria grammica]|nr:hypothetical protein F5X98DRAFT_347782 [Xylaria grammica]